MSKVRYLIPVVVPILTFALGWMAGQDANSKPAPQGGQTVIAEEKKQGLLDMFGGKNTTSIDPTKIDMEMFWSVWDKLNAKQMDMELVKNEDLVYGAIKGLTEAIGDPYTYFLPPSDTKEFNDSLNGDLEGIGAEISKKDGQIVVVSPLKNSPAEKAGLKPEDIIFKINDEVASEFSLFEAVSKIRGKPGTSVKLTVVRKDSPKPLEFEINREAIKVPSVEGEMKEEIAYLTINQFGNTTVDEAGKILNELMLKNPKGLILDLRYNGGGYLDGAVGIVSFFVEKGVVVTIKMRDTAQNETKFVNGRAMLANTPMVVLVNKGSASASEIVAGALQDYGRATIVGETTYGKGSVQELEPLKDGSSLRFTIAKWYTPNNRNIDKKGIEPDVKVEVTDKDAEEGKDPQLEKALSVLREKK